VTDRAASGGHEPVAADHQQAVPHYEDSEAPEPPAHWAADVVGADGGSMHIRPVRPSDAAAIVEFHAGLSTRTRYLRYFSPYPRIPTRDLFRYTHVDHHGRVALVAVLGHAIIAVGRYEQIDDTDEAEVAFVVADAHQGRGIGSVLLEHLAAAARECGIKRFHAIVLAENTGMMRVFRDAGYEVTRSQEYGEVTLEFAVDETAVTEAVMREREQHAEARSIQRLLCPRTVAVVGASNDPHKIGNALFGNLIGSRFAGAAYPVNRGARPVAGVAGHARVRDIPGGVDLAVVAVPIEAVAEVVDDCAAAQARGMVVITGGFGERGSPDERARGLAAQRQLVTESRAQGMRVVGPNCLGVVNTDPAVRLNASLAPVLPPLGRAGFFSQSGALGITLLAEAARRGLGVSTFVSAGNRADVSGNDMLQYWESDPATDVALLYLESFGNPRKFARLARRLGRSKPIVAVRSGAAPAVAGLRSTTVPMSEPTIRALFEASGVIRVDTIGDLFDVALLLVSQPLPAGDRIAVVGNSAALGVLVANACAAAGLPLTRDEDVGADASVEQFEAAMADVCADDGVDAVLAVFAPPLQRTPADDFAAVVRAVAERTAKPVLSTFLGFDGVPAGLAGEGDSFPPRGSVPSYPSPERAVRALARAVRYAQWRLSPPSTVPEFGDVDVSAARKLVEAVLRDSPGGRQLSAAEVDGLIACFGLTHSFEVPFDAVEIVLRLADDSSFGGLISFGIGGVATELLGDLAYASVPLTTAEAEELIVAPRAAPLLTGYRGSTPCDLHALQDLALRLAALGDALPEVAECTVDGLAAPVGVYLRSVAVRVAPATARMDSGPRRLAGL
jgi:acyl-CoA synthetase (NDP forming)/RimJ/RimL family protein N-acetyltransferase